MIDRRDLLRAEYVSRVNRVLDHIDANLDGDLSLDKLASVAGFSRFHFHRIFASMIGEALNGYVGRIRIERAALLLLNDRRASITEVALACGYASPAAFARAFRQVYGTSASEWRANSCRSLRASSDEDSKKSKAERKDGEAGGSGAAYPERVAAGLSRLGAESPRISGLAGGMTMAIASIQPQSVRVEDVPELHLAYVRHIGPYQGDGELFGRLIGQLMRWAGPRGLGGSDPSIVIIYHDNPEITEPEKLRISVCAIVPADTPVDGEVGRMSVPGGRYAIARFEVANDEYGAAWSYVYGQWLPESGYQPDDRQCFEGYPRDARPSAPEKTVVDIYVPVRPL